MTSCNFHHNGKTWQKCQNAFGSNLEMIIFLSPVYSTYSMWLFFKELKPKQGSKSRVLVYDELLQSGDKVNICWWDPAAWVRLKKYDIWIKEKKGSSQWTVTEPSHSCLGAIDQYEFTRQISSIRMAVEHNRTESLSCFCLFGFILILLGLPALWSVCPSMFGRLIHLCW